MNHVDPELRDQLAAEYALGTLSDADRHDFERLLSGDRDLRKLVEDWELRLNLLAESAPAVEPPAHVWDEIGRRIAIAPAPPTVGEGWLDRLWDSIGFWRGAAALATATAAALVLYVAFHSRSVAPDQIAVLDQRLARIEGVTRGLASRVEAVAARPTHVAVLLDKDQRPMMTADLDTADGRLVLRLNLTPPRDFTANVLGVWLIPQAGTLATVRRF